MFFGGLILFREDHPNLITTPLRVNSIGTNRLIMDTFIFHVFMLMNLFNAINCRVIAMNELNVFKTLHHNWIFIMVLIAEFLFQQWMVQCGSQDMTIQSAILGTGKLTKAMNIVAWVLGALSLAVGVGAKKVPTKYFEFTDGTFWSLEKETDVRQAVWAFCVNLCKKKESEADGYSAAPVEKDDD